MAWIKPFLGLQKTICEQEQALKLKYSNLYTEKKKGALKQNKILKHLFNSFKYIPKNIISYQIFMRIKYN